MRSIDRHVLAVLAALAAGGPALADAVPQSVAIAVAGSVGRMCILGDPQVNIGSSTNIGNVAGASVTIAELSSGQSLSTKATDFYVTLSGMCNFSHQITVSSDRGGLWRDPAGAPVSGFANGVPYRATIDWDSQQTTLLANAATESQISTSLPIDSPGNGDVSLHFHVDQNATNDGAGAPLVAGTYDDTIRITLGPQ